MVELTSTLKEPMKSSGVELRSPELRNAWNDIAGDETRIVDDLTRMVEIDTSFPPGSGYPAFADLMEALFAPLGFEFERVSVPAGLCRTNPNETVLDRVNLIASRASRLPTCSIYFHVDTVPAGDGWSWPAHAVTREGDRLYGRGTTDMKGTIAATLAALRAAQAHGIRLHFAPKLLFCTDEEGGLYPGIRFLAERGDIEGHLLSLNGSAAPRIWAGCFGSVDFRVTLFGRGAHSGEPHRGINAVEEAIPVLRSLLKLKATVESRMSTMPAPPHHDGRPLHGLLTIAAVNGGQKGSSVPAQVTILVNRRYDPEEDFEAVRKEIEETIHDAVKKTYLCRAEIAVIGHLVPVGDPFGPHWPRWQAAFGAGFGYAPEEFSAWGSSTSSDMGFVQKAGIQEILLGGLSRPDNNVHAPDEFTTLDDLKSLARAILLYVGMDSEKSSI